ncbi:hypothetical protein [Bacillus cereus]|uniref:hypothetical protein n=2 Tax=Bacillus cereus group TaxID=86661 RepID=UPI000279228F|nr:hypothetical protein [Bacillus cereus]EJQ34600.1 hypothetical protein IE9_00323 [Bacillus cereus BAG4X12-1]EOP79668.1 hypothetical protein IEG_04230 [Bacillus cereus BAG5X12-1]MEB9368480.1 hypothetical protein [Bacillus cereus]PER67352.1 hypothetical protein CN502_15855 [Bacillus cereus]PES43396.1 hypothetical protein CN515_33250 [Bacillus cereus]
MLNEKEIVEEIVKRNRNILLSIHEQYDKIDSNYGRRLAIMGGQCDSIKKELDTLGKELREQYYSLGRRMELLELQVLQVLKNNNK